MRTYRKSGDVRKSSYRAIAVLVLLLLNPVVAAVGEESVSSKALASIDLPHTDGMGLQPKPAPLAKAEQSRLFEVGKISCDSGCSTPFGTHLGTADGAEAMSNCQSTCIRPAYSFLHLETGEVSVFESAPDDANQHYIGLVYQCVNYARKWWMKNWGVTFPSIDSAHEIIYLTEGIDIRSKQRFPLARSINGTATHPPKRGDLVVYYPDTTNPEWIFGHVAVVVAVDLEKGVVSLAEENYDNVPWESPQSFSRKIQLFQIAGRYTLLDVPPDSRLSADGGQISGWIYPLDQR